MARSKDVAPGVGRLSRSQVFAKRGLFKGMKKSEPKPKAEVPPTKEVKVGGANNGTTRVVPSVKASRYYPAEDVRAPKKSRKAASAVTKLRATITPGTILILLAGRFRGKRVVFLKQLESGLLLVTGPYKINGVPLRRVNQAYTIATSTKVDLGEFKVRPRYVCRMHHISDMYRSQTDEKLTDAYFGKPSKKSSGSAEEEFFAEGKPKTKEAFPESKAADQKSVDKAVIAAVAKTENLAKYLKSSWGLSKGQFPHELTF
jgi:large subunit ribosomal protein L6e